MAIRIADDYTGTTNGHPANDNQFEVDRRQLELEALILTHDGLAYIKPPKPLIDGWLYENSLAWLSGKPGDGKSFIALDMGYSIGTGTHWQGHPVQQGTVLYLAAEGATGLSIRANAWMQAHGQPDNPAIFYLPIAVNLTDPTQIDVQALTQLLAIYEPVLVIIDTQARVTTGAEENSSKDMGRFIDSLETLRAANPATYLIVHHTPRNGDNLRGSTALEGAADTVLRSIKEGDVLTLECKKQKNAAEAEDFQLYMQPIGDSIVCSHEAVELWDSTTPSQDQLLKLMREQYGSDDAPNTELRAVSGLPEASYYRTVNPLVQKGKLIRTKQGRSTYYRLAQP